MVHDCFDGLPVFAMDLETTGTSSRSDRIIQYAFIGSRGDGTEVRIEELVNPKRVIPWEASNINGIYNRDVADLHGFETHHEVVYELVQDSVIIGHNVRRFDMDFIINEFLRLGQRPPVPLAVIDTLEVVRRLKLPRPHNLGSLCKRYGIELVDAHTAAADAAASSLLLWRLIKDYPSYFRRTALDIERWLVSGSSSSSASELGRGLEDLEPLDRQGRVRKDGERLILAFGRHKAASLAEVEDRDSGYLDWLTSPASVLDDESRELVKAHVSAIRSA